MGAEGATPPVGEGNPAEGGYIASISKPDKVKTTEVAILATSWDRMGWDPGNFFIGMGW